ncbi:MAG TPA: type II toxin-antitoxin system VapC family toxin [Longimicrobium sp.]|nr:type II toxin-antitoxin system VapC family toxin [Longimicrobium sp.]
MSAVLVDSNVLLDVLMEDPVWSAWSAEAIKRHEKESELVINPVIYAEVSVKYSRVEDVDDVLPPGRFRRDPLPWEAAFLAGKSYLVYRRRGGERRAPLPDFYIGAHAAVHQMRLLTRDTRRYRSYFPTLDIISP